MVSKQPFARRILIAFVLMTTLVSGLFSLSIVAVVHFIEEHLVSQELSRELNEVLHADISQGRPPRLDSATRFFASDLADYAIPEQFAGLSLGFNEVMEGNQALYVYTHELNGRTYMLVQQQEEFEAREQALFDVVLAGFLLTVIAAWALGVIMARKVMEPITRLALQVRHRDQLNPLAPALAPEYPDELLAESPLGPRERDQLQRISRASEEMRELVQTFLQLARDKANAGAPAPSNSLASIASEQANRWGPLLRDKGLDFQFINEGVDGGLYNPTLLSTVISNLLRNALHYTEQGFVRLVLEPAGLRVEDSGSGIPLEQHESIFQPFVRGTQPRGEGLGLGLSLVKRICTRQGWVITVSSLPAGGTCFRVVLTTDK
jgi:signal transduction histidine kinase